MKTIQRIYLYSVWLISLEVSLWAAIDLGRTLVTVEDASSHLDHLASASAFLLVGLLVFALHAWLIKRQAVNEEERFSRTRATFQYVAAFSFSVPVVQNLLACLGRGMATLINLRPMTEIIGGDQTWPENLIAILLSALAAWLVFRKISVDWQAQPKGDSYAEMRRVWRYAWLVYGVGISFFGASELVQYLAFGLWPEQIRINIMLINGLALLPVGAVIWWLGGQRIRRSLAETDEARSTFRLVILFLLALVPAAITVLSGRYFLHLVLLRWMQPAVLQKNVSMVRETFGTLVPAVITWWYFQQVLRRRWAEERDPLRQATLRRLYRYALALLGLVVALIGLVRLIEPLADFMLGVLQWERNGTQVDLTWAAAGILAGLPLWLVQWLAAQREANAADSFGEPARGSLTRRAYLYLGLFAGILGVMDAAGGLIYYLFRLLLGLQEQNYGPKMLQFGLLLLLFGGLMWLHWSAIRRDRSFTAAARAEQRAAFRVVVLDTGEGDFGAQMAEALQAEAPEMQVQVHQVGAAMPETLPEVGAVILPASLSSQLSGKLGQTLAQYNGTRLVVPDESPGWVWIGAAETNPEPLRKQAARLTAQLAQGEPGAHHTLSLCLDGDGLRIRFYPGAPGTGYINKFSHGNPVYVSEKSSPALVMGW